MCSKGQKGRDGTITTALFQCLHRFSGVTKYDVIDSLCCIMYSVFFSLFQHILFMHIIRTTGELIRSECSRAARSDACRTIGVRMRTPVRIATLTSAYSSRPQKTKSRQAIIHTSIALM